MQAAQKLSDARINEIYRPFAMRPSAETAQAVLDQPGMPERLRKIAFNYTEIGQKCRAESARSAAAQAVRNLLTNRHFLSENEIFALENALALVETIAQHPEYQEARAYQQDLHAKNFLDNCNKGN